jgi:hypothetical protein
MTPNLCLTEIRHLRPPQSRGNIPITKMSIREMSTGHPWRSIKRLAKRAMQINKIGLRSFLDTCTTSPETTSMISAAFTAKVKGYCVFRGRQLKDSGNSSHWEWSREAEPGNSVCNPEPRAGPSPENPPDMEVTGCSCRLMLVACR